MAITVEEANRYVVITHGTGRMHRARMLPGLDGFAVTLCGLETFTRADYDLDDDDLPWDLCKRCAKLLR